MKTILTPFLTLLASAPLVAQLETDALQTELERWAGDKPGAIVALVIDGEASGFASAGKWSATDERRADRNTVFEIGSVSKVLTSLLASDAVEKGVLLWDEKVGGGFADSPVTYAMLATHTSGLPSLPADFPAVDLVDPYHGLTVDDLRVSFAAEVTKLDAAALPAAWSYSNLAVSVLGQAVAAELGETYAEAVQSRVLRPLGLNATRLTLEDADAGQLAPGHNASGPTPRWRFDGYAPAGAWLSTAADLERFMRGMLKSDAAGADTRQPQAQTGGPDAMGYGWLIREVTGAKVYWHNGSTGGYYSFLGVQPETGRGIVVLAARNEAVEGIGFAWLQGLLQTTSAPVSAENLVLEDYIGDYPLAPQFVIAVSVRDGRLFAQATGQPRLLLAPDGADAFAFEGVAARLVFGRDEAGKVSGLVLHQGGREMPAPRRDASEPKPALQRIALSADQVAGLDGVYELAPSALLTVTLEGTEVFAQLTGQSRFPIHASAPDEFFYDVVDAQIRFKRDESGAVTGLVLHQNGREIPARKR